MGPVYVLIGCLLAAATLWQLHPAAPLAPALLLIVAGLLMDDGEGA